MIYAVGGTVPAHHSSTPMPARSDPDGQKGGFIYD